jgi:pimeloyl-ACP methyl ester carboxylesterase
VFRWVALLALSGCLLLTAGCASLPDDADQAAAVAEAQAYISSGGFRDARGRFREILCEVLEARGAELPDYRPCEEALRSIGDEGGATGAPVPLGASDADYLVLLVPGLGWNCFEEWLDLSHSAPRHVAQFGYEVRPVPVDGLSSSDHNAALIRDYVASLPQEDAGRPIILVGYSKGAPDALEAVATFPEVGERVVAVISLSGSVYGSPLADDASQATANMLSIVPGSRCDKESGDNDAVASLRPAVRRSWLEQHPLPEHIRYYSMVSFPHPERVSWALRHSYLTLAEVDSRNDTQMIFFDQLIPGSTVVAVLNADHWAVAVPVERSHHLIGSTLVNRNDYPREALLEALLRYLEEDLDPAR